MLEIILILKWLFVDYVGRRILGHFVCGLKQLLIVLQLLELLLEVIELLVVHINSVLVPLFRAIALQLVSFPEICSKVLIFNVAVLSLLTARIFFESLMENVWVFIRVLLQPLFI